ncbi:hypothetical protein FQR65_LT01877 [Abscondita terminalis]|nr:hypothetical protein FQR65_LT01877 [Abscondita terminalis]
MKLIYRCYADHNYNQHSSRIQCVHCTRLKFEAVGTDVEDDVLLANVASIKKKKKLKKTPERKRKSAKANQCRQILPWKGKLSNESQVGTSLYYFWELIDMDILEEIEAQSKWFAVWSDLTKPLSQSIEELRRFMSITFLMPIYRLPQTRMKNEE